MFKNSKIFSILLLSFFIPTLFTPLISAMITVQSGIFLNLESVETINSETATSGKRVNFRVINDVIQDGVVIIKAGANAVGKIQSVNNKGMLGKPGEIAISLTTVTAVDNTQIPISASQVYKGKDKSGTSLIVGLLLCFLFLFMKGDDGVLQSGSIIEAQIIGSPQISIE